MYRDKKPIKLYYQPAGSNFGDMLSPRLVSAILGRDCVPARPQSADLVAIGSLMERCVAKRWKRPFYGRVDPLCVWGPGFLYPGRTYSRTFLSCIALRGQYSRDRVRGVNRSCVLGDPGLLTGLLFPQASAAKGSDILVFRNIADQGEWVRAALDNEQLRAHHVSVSGDVDDILSAIANADLVISSAMHPLIIAISYGKPVIWVDPDESGIEGGRYKYYDFFSAFGMQPEPVSRSATFWTTTSLGDLLAIARQYTPSSTDVVKIADRLQKALAHTYS